MGDLIKQTPYSEITATLELLDTWGVQREHLAQFRRASSWFQQQVAAALISGKEDYFSGSSHSIDCDADPFLPNGWRVDEHRRDGVVVWDPSKVSLYLSKGQEGDKYIVGNDLRKELAKKPTMNANVLDYLLKNPHLIPEEWKKDDRGNTRYIFFWGTVYRDSGDRLYVRCLCWRGGAWDWNYYWLGYVFHGYNPAALRAS